MRTPISPDRDPDRSAGSLTHRSRDVQVGLCARAVRCALESVPPPPSGLWAVCCGAVTSLSPRCHPASAGLRHTWPLPKPHSATSAIHKRQPLSLSDSLAHSASNSHTPPFLFLPLVHPRALTLISKFHASPFLHSFDYFLPLLLVLFMLNINRLFPYLSFPRCPFSLPPRLYPHPVEKSLTHYIFSGSQPSVVAANWEPQDIPDPKKH